MHDELQKLNKEELIQIINEKTDYLSMIVHQLRTPLTAEKWFLEMLYTGNLDILNLSEKKNLIKKSSGEY